MSRPRGYSEINELESQTPFQPGVLHSAHTAAAAPLIKFNGVPFSVWERPLRSERVSLTASPAWLTRVLTDWESAHQLAG